MIQETPNFAVLDLQTALSTLGVKQEFGLTDPEAKRRLDLMGPNCLPRGKKQRPLSLMLGQFKDLSIWVLLAAALISFTLGEQGDTWAIIIIVLMNAFLGFAQEYRAESAMASLRKHTTTNSRVLRNGAWKVIDAEDLVPGDIISFEAGDQISADARLLEALTLYIDESALTGESLAVGKVCTALSEDNRLLADQKNLVFKGTNVTRGRGRAVVFATGMKTEIGKISDLLDNSTDRTTPLQLRLNQFGKRLALLVIMLCAIVFALGVLRNEPVMKVFMTSLSLAVAAIPEALPAIVTILLSFGTRVMAKQNAIIRKLHAVETLGSVTYICTDKTGTLTKNKMVVDSFSTGESIIPLMSLDTKNSRENWMAKGFILNNDTKLTADHKLIGDPTETAMIDAGIKIGLSVETIANEMPRISEVPFTSERMMMSTLHRWNDSRIMFVKGAPERIIPLCVNECDHDGFQTFNKQNAHEISAKMASTGLRVFAFAMRSNIASTTNKIDFRDEHDLTFLGFIGLIDPPREEAAEAIASCKTASITVVMITGDHPTTALAIASKLGILDSNIPSDELPTYVLSGDKLASLSDEELFQKVKHVRVYARTSPEQKIKIVRALKSSGEIVAMTGDGINDAPALKSSDIGVAMGKGGTDVARDASHMILLDDNFSTIVVAVSEGRRIYDNIRKFVRYVLSGNSGEIWALLLAPLLNMPLPLLPIQILFVNLLTDGLPGIALAAEPAEKDILRRPPRPPQESIFANGLWEHAIWIGLLLAGVTLLAFHLGSHTSIEHGRTMAFTVLTLGQLFHIIAIRSETDSIFSIGFSGNKQLLGVAVATGALQALAVFNPWMNQLFKTHPISFHEFLTCIFLAVTVGAAAEIEKFIRRKLKH